MLYMRLAQRHIILLSLFLSLHHLEPHLHLDVLKGCSHP